MSEKRPPGKDAMNSRGIAAVTIYLFAAIIVVIWALVALWPPIKSKDEPQGSAFASQTPPPAGQTPTPLPAGQTPTPLPAGQTPTPPASGQRPTPLPAGQTPTPPPAGQTPTPPPARQTPAPPGPIAGASVTPVAGATATPSPDECAVKHRFQGEFCLNEKGEIRKGIAPAKVFGWCGCLYDEDRLLWLVLLAGALGSLIHGLRSFVWYVGNREAVWSWSVYYLALPFIGSGIALIFYLVIRGGFFSTNATVGDTSPVGFAAIAALIGMFTEQAVQKLKSVSETILSPAEKGKDHIDGPKITSITPNQGQAGGGTKVTITGSGFAAGATVSFGANPATAVVVVNETTITANTPAGEGVVDVIVTSADGTTKTDATQAYTYVVDGDAAAGDDQDVHDLDLKPDTPDEDLPITQGGVG